MPNLPIRLLCISDIHGNFHKFPAAGMPDADAVLIAGDLTNMGTAGRTPQHFQEVFDAEVWMQHLVDRYQNVLYILGNHDIQISPTAYDHIGTQIFGIDTSSRLVTQKVRRIHDLLVTGINLSTCFDKPQLVQDWTNMTADPKLDQSVFDALPRADIVVSHCPPFGTRDYAGTLGDVAQFRGVHIGSPGLRNYIHTFTPRLVVCGHVHEAVGVEYITTVQGGTCVVNTAQTATLVTIAEDGLVEAELVV